MGALKDHRKELFAVRRVLALRHPEPIEETYRKIYPEEPATEVQAKAKRLANSVLVKRRMAEIVSQGAEIAKRDVAETLVMGEHDLKKFCENVIGAKPSEASFDNPLCDVQFTKAGPVPVFPKKMEALGTLARLMKLIGGESNVTVTLPSWRPTALEEPMGEAIDGERGGGLMLTGEKDVGVLEPEPTPED